MPKSCSAEHSFPWVERAVDSAATGDSANGDTGVSSVTSIGSKKAGIRAGTSLSIRSSELCARSSSRPPFLMGKSGAGTSMTICSLSGVSQAAKNHKAKREQPVDLIYHKTSTRVLDLPTSGEGIRLINASVFSSAVFSKTVAKPEGAQA